MQAELVACQDCDLIHRIPETEEGASGRCIRCDAVLFQRKQKSIERTIAFAVAGVLLFGAANMLPFLSFDMQGRMTETTLVSGVRELHTQGMTSLAALVAFTAILAPATQLLLLLYVLLPLHFGRIPWNFAFFFRSLRHVQPWSMMEVFMIGILVALVKLSDMAEIVPGLALYSFAMLIVALAGASATLDPRAVWAHIRVPN